MGKKFKSTRVYLQPDPVYHDKLVSQFINYIMLDGKKNCRARNFLRCNGHHQKEVCF